MTKSALNSHKKIHKSVDDVMVFDEEDIEDVDGEYNIDENITIIDDLKEWYSPLFIEG